MHVTSPYRLFVVVCRNLKQEGRILPFDDNHEQLVAATLFNQTLIKNPASMRSMASLLDEFSPPVKLEFDKTGLVSEEIVETAMEISKLYRFVSWMGGEYVFQKSVEFFLCGTLVEIAKEALARNGYVHSVTEEEADKLYTAVQCIIATRDYLDAKQLFSSTKDRLRAIDYRSNPNFASSHSYRRLED